MCTGKAAECWLATFLLWDSRNGIAWTRQSPSRILPILNLTSGELVFSGEQRTSILRSTEIRLFAQLQVSTCRLLQSTGSIVCHWAYFHIVWAILVGELLHANAFGIRCGPGQLDEVGLAALRSDLFKMGMRMNWFLGRPHTKVQSLTKGMLKQSGQPFLCLFGAECNGFLRCASWGSYSEVW